MIKKLFTISAEQFRNCIAVRKLFFNHRGLRGTQRVGIEKPLCTSVVKKILLLSVCCILSSCDTGFRQMGATEFGVRFARVPRIIGGGVSSRVISPGETGIVFPWETIYRFDTSVKNVSWGGIGQGNDTEHADYVYTRALDGNEVVLAVTVRYRIVPDPKTIIKIVEHVAISDQGVRDLVTTIARADIRTYMNKLRTSAFLERKARYEAVDNVRDAMAKRLSPYGIEIERVNLDDFRFERLLEDGTVDASYQEKLKEIQKLREDTEREKSRVATIEAKKQQEFNEAQGQVSQKIAQAQGIKNQAASRGDSYFQARSNESEAILAKGKAEVEGLIEQIHALSGPGGKALLKIELVKQLLKNNPRFVAMGDSDNKSQMTVKKIDANELLGQVGIMEALKEEQKGATK